MGVLRHRMSFAVLLTGMACVVVFLAAPVDSVLQIAAWFVPFALATGLLGARLKGSPPAIRGPLGMLFAGCLLYAAASLVWYVGPVRFGWQLPFPSPLDAAFFLAHAAYAAFFVMVLRRGASADAVGSRIALTDSLIVTTSASAVLWVAVISPNLTNGTAWLPTAVAVLYPAFILVLFALTARLAVLGRLTGTGPGLLLLVWVGGELAGDVVHGIQSANGTFSYDLVLTAYMAAYTALAALAVHPGFTGMLSPGAAPAVSDSAELAGRRMPGAVRPAFLLLASLVPLVLAGWQQEHVVALLATTAVTFGLATYRTSLVAGDLGEQRRLAARLEQAVTEVGAQRDGLARLAAVVHSTDDSVIMMTPGGLITSWNPGAERAYGYSDAEALGAHVSMIIAPERIGIFGPTMAALAEGQTVRLDTVHVRKDGSRVPTSVAISTVYDDTGGPIGVVAIARDMTERNRAEEQARDVSRQLEAQASQLARLAYSDPLTGLGNRTLFGQRLSELAQTAAPDAGGRFALVVLDLDDFKVVNDSLGHATGDALLVAAAERLRAVVGDGGTVARLGGDEFAVLLDSADETGAVRVAELVLAQFYRDFHVLGHALRTTASVGIAAGSPDADATDLLRNADLAMYAAKAAGKGKLAVYRSEMFVEAQQRLDLENHLRHAVEHEEMHLAYQPIVDAATGGLCTVEALLRWQHPTWGMVSPATFIPVAERSGTIVPLGAWVLRTACRDARELADQRGGPVRVAVNVSARQLHAADFASVVRSALDDSGIDPALLTLELTESLLMDEDGYSTAVLRELSALGVRLSIDDFGTGHSSLARLRTLPVTELKIDRAFVHEMGPDGDCGPIITAIVAMARALGLSVVAEGVETHVQLEALQRLGCDAVQGFLVARPTPLADLRFDFPAVKAPAPGSSGDNLLELVTRLRAHASRTGTTTSPVTELVREALAELVSASGLDTMYLTRVDLASDVQQVLLAHSTCGQLVPEGLVVDWSDTLCKRASEIGPGVHHRRAEVLPRQPSRARAGSSDLHQRPHPAPRRRAGRHPVRGLFDGVRAQPGRPDHDRDLRARHRSSARRGAAR